MVVALLTVARLIVDASLPLPMTVMSEDADLVLDFLVDVADDVMLAGVLDPEELWAAALLLAADDADELVLSEVAEVDESGLDADDDVEVGDDELVGVSDVLVGAELDVGASLVEGPDVVGVVEVLVGVLVGADVDVSLVVVGAAVFDVEVGAEESDD
jgi:hypothetical protein